MELKQLVKMLEILDKPEVVQTSQTQPDFELGKAYLIRTVTMMYTGRVVSISGYSVKLEQAAWVADSGRYSRALETGELSEVEVYPNGCNVTLQSIVDFAPWENSLPTETK